MPRARLTPPPTRDPEEFWLAQHRQAVKDAQKARTKAPSVLPKMVQLERDAWRELQTARAAKSGGETPPKDLTIDTSLEHQLHQVRNMRTQAETSGRLTAAEKLLRREGELVEEIRKRDEAKVKAARASKSTGEVLGTLAAKIQAMPDAMRDELRRRLGW